MAEVRLVDLEIIKRYSLAVRREKAPAKELLAALDASRAAVEAAIGGSSSSSSKAKGRRSRTTKAGAIEAAEPVHSAHVNDVNDIEDTDEGGVFDGSDLGDDMGFFDDIADADVSDDDDRSEDTQVAS